MKITNEILLELIKRLQADPSIRVDLQDLLEKLADEMDYKTRIGI